MKAARRSTPIYRAEGLELRELADAQTAGASDVDCNGASNST